MSSYNFEASNAGMMGYDTFINTSASRSIDEFVHSIVYKNCHLTYPNYLYNGKILNLVLTTCILINSILKNLYSVDKKVGKYKQDHIKVLLNNQVMTLSDLDYTFAENVSMKDLIVWYSNGYIEIGFITEMQIRLDGREKSYHALLILDKNLKINIALLNSYDKAINLLKETFQRKSGQIYMMVEQADPYIVHSYVNINIEDHNVYRPHFYKNTSKNGGKR
jgi:hypothetical protein